ncbi:MAG: hypothetical protein NTY77_15620 [Elusimicrobia bacterium]|nr:hypothetical protein [Elusimicrobiota bacterium]
MMMMRAAPAVAAAFLAVLVGVTGCTHYTLKPEPVSSMPRSSEPPLPLRVGLVLDEQRSALAVNDPLTTQQMLEREGYAFGPKFAQALRQSRLFQDVRFPLRLSREAYADVDLVISAQFGYKFNQDPWQAPKIVLCVFTGLITGAIMSETSHHLAQGVLSVEDAAGRSVRSYDETVDVEAKSMVSMFAEMKTMKVGPPAAADNVIAKLVQRLIDDRALFKARPAAPPAVPAPVAAPPVAAVEPTAPAVAAEPAHPAVAVSAASETPPEAAAPPVQVPVQPEPKPISSETYDDQLLP